MGEFQKAKTHCKRGHEFSLENTHIDKQGRRVCRECMNAHMRNFRAKHKDALVIRRKNTRRNTPKETLRKEDRKRSLSRLGWTPETFAAALNSQDSLCAICGIKMVVGGAPSNGTCPDHEHTKPPKPRGILCMSCNKGIGFFKENTESLRAAIAYLEKYN